MFDKIRLGAIYIKKKGRWEWRNHATNKSSIYTRVGIHNSRGNTIIQPQMHSERQRSSEFEYNGWRLWLCTRLIVDCWQPEVKWKWELPTEHFPFQFSRLTTFACRKFSFFLSHAQSCFSFCPFEMNRDMWKILLNIKFMYWCKWWIYFIR